MEFKIFRTGIIDGIQTQQDITDIDIWSDASRWLPLTPHHQCTYILKIEDLHSEPESNTYLTANFNKHDNIFVPCFKLEINCEPVGWQSVYWKIIRS